MPSAPLAAEASDRRRSAAGFLLRCVVSVALIALVVRKANWVLLGSILRQADMRLVLVGSLCTLPLIAMLALRWRMFLRQQQLDVPFTTVFPLTWAGQFFNSVLPGSTGGDVVKIIQICRLLPDRKASATATVFVDRVSALVALLVLAGTALPFVSIPHLAFVSWKISIPTLVLFAGLALGGAWLGGWLAVRFLQSTPWLGRIQRMLAAAFSSFRFNLNLIGALALSFAIHLWNFLIVFLFARSLGVAISYTQVLLIMPIVLLLVMIPVTVNGHGLREVLLIHFFKDLHIGLTSVSDARVNETVVALSVLLITNDLLWSLPGGVWFWRTRRATAPSPPPSADNPAALP